MTEIGTGSTNDSAAETIMNPPAQPGKRKRSPSETSQPRPAPAAHAASTSTTTTTAAQANHHVQINYLARHCTSDLPLVGGDDSLPAILGLITDYEGVLQRNESMAANLGAKPKGQALLSRFERMFDGPVKVIQSNAKESVGGANGHGNGGSGHVSAAPAVTWLDVVEFAKNRPAEFTLNQVRRGTRLCQIWVKSCKVEVMEDDFDVIKYNPNPIPPQPIQEDEEKELGTLEILDKSLQHVISLADAVSGRARQLNRRLRARKSAVTGKRAGGSGSDAARRSSGMNGSLTPSGLHGEGSGERESSRSSHSPKSGFVAVNSRHADGDGYGLETRENGHHDAVLSKPINGVSAETHADLLRRFTTTKQRDSLNRAEAFADSPRASHSGGGAKARKDGADARETAHQPNRDGARGSLGGHQPGTPSLSTPHAKPSPAADDGGPYKGRMMTRVDKLSRGDKIDPPCDRCRRLRIECMKNLTACMGCTRKHAKCSWKDVKEDEMLTSPEASEAGGDDDAQPSHSGREDEGSEHGGSRERPRGADDEDEDEDEGRDRDRDRDESRRRSVSPSTGGGAADALARESGGESGSADGSGVDSEMARA